MEGLQGYFIFLGMFFASLISILIFKCIEHTYKKFFKENIEITQSNEFQETQQIISQIREAITYQILNAHPKLFNAIAKQRTILNNQNRKCIAIFVSESMFKELLQSSASYPTAELDILHDTMLDLKTPIGYLGELPIYISELLQSAPVFVVGEISWSFEV